MTKLIWNIKGIYTGSCAVCGQVVAGMCDTPGSEQHTAKTVAQFIRDGLIVDRLPPDAEVYIVGCKCAETEDLQPELPDLIGEKIAQPGAHVAPPLVDTIAQVKGE